MPDLYNRLLGEDDRPGVESDALWFEGRPFDTDGNPLIQAGCPNCGKGKRLVSQIEFAAASNSGRNLAGPCSSVCRSQLEYAKELAARKASGVRGGDHE